jgi:hypothetical protein
MSWWEGGCAADPRGSARGQRHGEGPRERARRWRLRGVVRQAAPDPPLPTGEGLAHTPDELSESTDGRIFLRRSDGLSGWPSARAHMSANATRRLCELRCATHRAPSVVSNERCAWCAMHCALCKRDCSPTRMEGVAVGTERRGPRREGEMGRVKSARDGEDRNSEPGLGGGEEKLCLSAGRHCRPGERAHHWPILHCIPRHQLLHRNPRIRV